MGLARSATATIELLTRHPRRPRALPRYLPVDEDRCLAEALTRSPRPLAANALLLARATGIRIGELVDLELDCVHEMQGTLTANASACCPTVTRASSISTFRHVFDDAMKTRDPGFFPREHPGRVAEFLPIPTPGGAFGERPRGRANSQ
jgi:hypothetical protein